ncbi:ABC transporter ATP-binding protein [uncultured Finegoldia sp.]|uniref:ABC transporter ATP-binding protein n=1 Tax=uncultured Finegoldia sp. TaxID=328009 RepID=UPI002605EC66|nr:ABC transporter ATP-binding protein [uncultured Finegoldia sp.]
MKNFLKNKFALTDDGVKGTIKASFYSFLVFVINMCPAILLMILMEQFLLDKAQSRKFYLIFSFATLIIMFILLSMEYESQYNETYKESAKLRIDLAKKLSELKMSYFSKHDLSDLAQSIMADVSAIEHASSHAIPKAIGFVFFMPLITVLMLIGNWKMTIVAVGPTLLSFLFYLLSKNYSKGQFNKYYVRLRENSNAFQQRIELSKEISAFNLSDKIRENLYAKLDDSEKIHWSTEKNNSLIMLFSGIFAHFSLPLTIILGIFLMKNGEISILYLLGYILAAMKIKEVVDSNTESFMEIFYIDSAVTRINEIRNANVLKGKDTEFDNFDVELKNVEFSYEDKKIIDKVSFTAPQGMVTAIVGESGCGKTTILRLISRLYDYDEGEILIGNQDIKQVSTESLYKNISIVFQDVKLFNTSIMENIRIGRKDATDEEVIAAAKLANCDFIENLKGGFEAEIGENGEQLSGGERQRLSIARAFLKDSPILILDEIASSLDVDNERKIQKSLNKLIKNKTVIIISHRMKSIENADKIVVLKQGKVEEIGTHDELLKVSETYKKLVEKTKAAEEFVY